MRDHNVKELNNFLKGEYMAINQYDHYIENIEDNDVKGELQNIQKEHRKQAVNICDKIQQLGGNPVDSVGVRGNVAGFFSNIINTKDTEKVLEKAMDGEKMGIDKGGEILANITDHDSKTLVNNILNQNKTIVNIINHLIEDNKDTENRH